MFAITDIFLLANVKVVKNAIVVLFYNRILMNNLVVIKSKLVDFTVFALCR